MREALAALEILGIVVVRPGSGTYLRDGISELLPRTLSWGLMLGDPRTRELVELRERPGSPGRPAGRGPHHDEALGRMRGNLAAMEDNLDDLAAFVEADAAFHREIAESSGNQVLAELLQSIRSLLRIWVDRALTDEGPRRGRPQGAPGDFQRPGGTRPRRRHGGDASHMGTASRRLLAGYDAAQ